MENQGVKTFDACLDCHFLGSTCGGPNFLAQEHERWAEWCSLRRKKLNISLDKLAELADLPKGTVVRALNKNTLGTSVETMKRITKVLVGGSWGKFPCADPPGENSELFHDLKEKDSALAYIKEEDSKKIDFLKNIIKEKSRIIKVLSGVVAGLGSLLVVVLMLGTFAQ